jgi:hypothetical protein
MPLDAGKTYGIDLSFSKLELPLLHDVLILAKNAAQGKHGLRRSLELLAPGTFQPLESDLGNEAVEAVFVKKGLLAKIPADRVTKVLQQYVFDHIVEGDLIQVDLKVRISVSNVNG